MKGSFFTMLVLYSVFFDMDLLYESNLCGFSGVIASFTVALKQLLPEQEVNKLLINNNHLVLLLPSL